MIELPDLQQEGQAGRHACHRRGATRQPRCARSLLKQAYVMFHANRRQGSARTKSRGMVDGSTRKLYRQKGTGNARVGNRRTVVRKGGGVAFAKTKDPRGVPAHAHAQEDAAPRQPQRPPRQARRQRGQVRRRPRTSTRRRRATSAKMLAVLGVDRTCLVALDSPATATRRCRRATSRTSTRSASSSSTPSSS